MPVTSEWEKRSEHRGIIPGQSEDIMGTIRQAIQFQPEYLPYEISGVMHIFPIPDPR